MNQMIVSLPSQLKKRISMLEDASLMDKGWQPIGETSAMKQPINR